MAATTGVLVRPTVPAGLRRAVGVVAAAALVAASIGQLARVLDASPARPPAAVPATAEVTESLGGLPMAWVANTGQTDPAVRYLAQGMGYATFLTDTEAVVRVAGAVVRLGFDGASAAPAISTEQPLASTVSAFAGSDPSKWQAGAATAEVVRYEDAWPGIDMAMRGTGSELEWDLHIDAGADPTVAGMTVTGADRIEVDGDQATLVLGDSELPLAIPAAWQTRPDGTRIERTARWDLDGDSLRVIPRDWDPDRPGVIDPTLSWSTYLGGRDSGDGGDGAADIAIDGSGNVYVTGSTFSMDFPTTAGAFDTTPDENAADVFVSKLAADGGALLYSTVLGSSGADAGVDIAVDPTGNAYLTGNTVDASTAFPTTAGAFDSTVDGSNDVFVTKLDSTGGALVFSTLLGGSGVSTGDVAAGIALGVAGRAYVTGTTTSPDFPVTAGAFDTTANGGRDVFVTEVEAGGGALSYSTLIGGTSTDEGFGLTADTAGHAYVTGGSSSPSFPTTAGAFDVAHNGQTDVFVSKLSPDGSGLVYSTFLGGSHLDYGYSVAIDGAGRAYVTGETPSVATTQYPTTPGAFDTTPNNGTDAFVTALDPAGGALVYSTRLGGSGDDRGREIAVDVTGHAHVAGRTPDAGTDYPTTPGAFDTTANSFDAFVTKLDPTGSTLDYSTRLGGNGQESPGGIALVAAGDAYITGSTSSVGGANDFPTTAGAYDTSPDQDGDAFVTKLDPTGSTLGFSTVIGGTRGIGNDWVTAIATDESGVYVAGYSFDGTFPTTPGAYDTTPTGSDVFVGKLDPTGSTLLYSTLIGNHGNLPEDINDLTVDGEGNAYIIGTTYHSAIADYPTTSGAFDTTHNGILDAFVTKIDATGSALLYSTFLGGSGYEEGWGLAVDGAGRAYVIGTVGTGNGTGSIPTTAGAYDTTREGFGSDAFVAKLEADGGSLAYSTYLGGLDSDLGRDVALDASGNAYVTGSTFDGATDFPTTPGAFDTTHNGGGDPTEDIPGEDVFVTKLNAAGSALSYSTLLGSYQDEGEAIAVDPSGSAYVTGSTGDLSSSENPPVDYPTTSGAFDTTPNGTTDVFVTKLSATGGALAYSTLLGGEGFDHGRAIAVDSAGFAYVTGVAGPPVVGAPSFPTTADAFDTSQNGWDAFVTRVDDSGTSLVYSTFLGGSDDEEASALALTANGTAAVGGYTRSTDFPVTPGAYDTTAAFLPANLNRAAFVSVLDLSVPPPVVPSGCNLSATPSAVIGWYPANPGSPSSLQVACVLANNPGSSQVVPSFTVHDANVAQFHNGAGRRVTTQSALASGVSSLQLTTASNGIAGVAGWENRPITGPGIAPGTFVKRVSGAGVATLSRPTVAAVAAGQAFTLENAPARRLEDASGAASSTTMTSASGNFTAADVGLSIAGTGISLGTTIASVTSSTQVVLSAPATLASPVVVLGETLLTTSTRQVTGATTVTGVRIGSTVAGWAASDAGLRVSGVCDNGPAADYVIPANVYIASPPSGAEAATTGGLLAGQTGCNLTIGDPSATAPLNGETVADQLMQLDLNPALVPGSDSCANEQPEGLALVGTWRNPGSFQGAGSTHAQPGSSGGAPTRAIGQIRFQAGAVGFSAFVIERPASTPGDPIPALHYDLQFPFVPTSTITCPGTATSGGLGFSLVLEPITASQSAAPAGTGRPGTNQVRSIRRTATGGYTTVAFVTSDTGLAFTPATNFRRICVYPTGIPNPVSFQCGSG